MSDYRDVGLRFVEIPNCLTKVVDQPFESRGKNEETMINFWIGRGGVLFLLNNESLADKISLWKFSVYNKRTFFFQCKKSERYK